VEDCTVSVSAITLSLGPMAASGCASQNPATHPLDAMRKAPGHHDVLLENEKVRILDRRLSPGDRTPVHAHEWPAALYVPERARSCRA
jgi:hypothetical protein